MRRRLDQAGEVIEPRRATAAAAAVHEPAAGLLGLVVPLEADLADQAVIFVGGGHPFKQGDNAAAYRPVHACSKIGGPAVTHYYNNRSF